MSGDRHGGTDDAPIPGDPGDADRSGTVSRRLRIARRELAALKSEKTIVLAILIQLFVAAFSSFLVVGLVSLYDPGSVEGYTLEVGVVGGDAGADDLTTVMARKEGVQPRGYATQSEAMDAFRQGEVDAVLVTRRAESGVIYVRAIVPEGSIRTTVVVVQLQSALEGYERVERGRNLRYLDRRPLEVPDPVSASPYYDFTYTVLIPLLMFLPVFVSGSIAVDSMTEEIQRGTLELLRVAPVSEWDIVDGKLLAAAGLAPVQALAWLALLAANGTRVANPAGIVVVVSGVSVAVVAVGLGLALLAPDRRQAQFLYSTGVLGVFAVTTLLPEHPANTIARLAIGSVAASTWIAVAGYVGIGAGAYLGVRGIVSQLDVESL